ncbi:MAG: hypothetical protein C7B44_12805 [Sulfobacillus thermosulfidooxidans]|nr:MAG: hypothetical protein C7B44_12805 [Sulfobacillus thermosulfidooxidans]
MRHSAVLPYDVHQAFLGHLLRSDGQEDACFALWRPSAGQGRTSALLVRPIFPESGDRLVHGNVEITPQYFSKAIRIALQEKCGIALLHSHLGPGWQDMSDDDMRGERIYASRAKGATGLPLVGLTLGTDGSWSARFWEKTAPSTYDRIWCESTRVVGHGVHLTFDDRQLPISGYREELSRTVSAWGERVQGVLSRLTVGVVGVGSVGSMVAESLARMGVGRIVLMDFDSVEAVNLDRHLHATTKDIGRAKVRVTAEALRVKATARNFEVIPFEYSVVEPEGLAAALDCDLIFSCVDRPWARHVLNFIAKGHLIPVIDGGVLAEPTKQMTGLKRADVRAHVVMPETACLACMGQYRVELVQAEREGSLDDNYYIKNLPSGHELKRNENVFAFSMMAASLEVRQLISLIATSIHVNPQQSYHFVTGGMDSEHKTCDAVCSFQSLLGIGDHSPVVLTGIHHIAEHQRQMRNSKAAVPSPSTGSWFRRLVSRLKV